MAMKEITADICIVGGGSGGVGAAYQSATCGAKVVLIEQQPCLGGTSTLAWVSEWAPGPGAGFYSKDAATDLAFKIYETAINQGVCPSAGLTRDFNAYRQYGNFGLWLVDRGLDYPASLCRFGMTGQKVHGVYFPPEKLSFAMYNLLNQFGNLQILLNTRFEDVELEGNRIVSITAINTQDNTQYKINASIFIDSTADIALCRKAGCKTELSAELNSLSLCYKIKKVSGEATEPNIVPDVKWKPSSAHITGNLEDDFLIVNPMAMLSGDIWINDPNKAQQICKERVSIHWNWLMPKINKWAEDYCKNQGIPVFHYELSDSAPMLGVRESYRVVSEYILTEDDIQAGLVNQNQPDIIAIADHPLDMIEASLSALAEQKEVFYTDWFPLKGVDVKKPYGVPYRCLIPEGWDNILVACRGAGFSHLAASSCRLSRTMMALGVAAGQAASVALNHSSNLLDVYEKYLDELQNPLGIEKWVNLYKNCTCPDIQSQKCN